MFTDRYSAVGLFGLLTTTLAATLAAELRRMPSPVAPRPRPDRTASSSTSRSALTGPAPVPVDPQWVLTAASCFPENVPAGKASPTGEPKKATVATIGRPDLFGTGGHEVAVVDLIGRPDRNLVLAKLASGVTDVAPVKLASTAPATGDVLRVAGYGRTATEWVPGKVHTAGFRVERVAESTLDIVGVESAASICQGDSGGPALREVGGVTELVSIHTASWQGGCFGATETRRNAVETRVDDIAAWIREQLPLTAVCKPETPVFAVGNDGRMRLYKHADSAGGTFNWTNASGTEIGQGWLGARTIAGPGGNVYAAVENGQLRRYRWSGSAWLLPRPTQQLQYQLLETGWENYATAPLRNRITVDAKDHVYTIEADGRLHWRAYPSAFTDPTVVRQHRVLEGDWSGYDLIVAAGKGVFYARTTGGALFRFQYDAATDQFTQWAKPAGLGWNMFNSMMSAGGDTLYGARADNGGELLWYRYLPATNSWVDTGRGVGKLVGTGWYGEYNITAAPDSCTLS